MSLIIKTSLEAVRNILKGDDGIEYLLSTHRTTDRHTVTRLSSYNRWGLEYSHWNPRGCTRVGTLGGDSLCSLILRSGTCTVIT